MAKKKDMDPLYVKSKIRDYIKSKGMNTSSGVIDGDKLNLIIMEKLNRAVERAKGNKRKTVKSRDL
ncbi:MAG: hypothetical protein P8Y70_05010 [Candidatus Lokiarchaeota archaeon]